MRRNSIAIIAIAIVVALVRLASGQGDFSGAVTDSTMVGTGTVKQPLGVATPTPSATATPTPAPTVCALCDITGGPQSLNNTYANGTFADISTALTPASEANSLHLGTGSLAGALSADFNTAVGFQALNGNTSGQSNTAFGYQALFNETTNSNSTAVGKGAGVNATNSQNDFFGAGAGNNVTSGASNDGFGYNALVGTGSITGCCNTAIGLQALAGVTGAANNNVALGPQAGFNTVAVSSGDHNTAIGANAHTSAATDTNETMLGNGAAGAGSNTVQLGNTSVTKVNTSGQYVAGIASFPYPISAGVNTFGLSSAYPSSTVLMQNTAPFAGHFVTLTCSITLFGTCTTAPIVNIFDGTSNVGTQLQCPGASTQTKGNGTTSAQTLTFAAGDKIGIYVVTQGATCLADQFAVSADATIP